MKLSSSFVAGLTGLWSLIVIPANAQEAVPTSVPLERSLVPVFEVGEIKENIQTTEAYSNFRMVLKYDAAEAGWMTLSEKVGVEVPAGKGRSLEIAYEHFGAAPAGVRVWVDRQVVEKGRDFPDTAKGDDSVVMDAETSTEVLRLDRDFTVMVDFTKDGKGGALFSKNPGDGTWQDDAKGLFVRDGKLVFEIAGFGKLEGKTKLKRGEKQIAIIVSEGGRVSLFLNGKLEASREKFAVADLPGSVFKIGTATTDFKEDIDGRISGLRFWGRGLDAEEIENLSTGNAQAVNTPDLNWSPDGAGSETEFGAVPGHAVRPLLHVGRGFVIESAFVQPLAMSDHAALAANWDDDSRARGKVIYNQLCVTCHGTLEAPGSLPTATRFHLDDFKNGADPYRMFQTLEKGYGQMVAQAQYTTSQKYDVIHYLREEFLKGKNEAHLVPVDDDYLAKLPRGMSQLSEQPPEEKAPQYKLQDFGNTLFWTLQVEEGNIAQKGIAVRLDDGPGGVSKGKAWMLYEHDTMRLAACWTGDEFVDWKGIAFDGSHGTHTSIAGETHFTFPNEPMWANPETGDFEDLRILGRDGLPYGPLPREWVRFKGLEVHGATPAIRYSVGDCEIREVPKLGENGAFERWIYGGPRSMELKLKLDDERIHMIPGGKEPFEFGIRYLDGTVEVFTDLADGKPAAQPVSERFDGILTTSIKTEQVNGAWAVDVLETPAPADNPWQSWMRTSGFDFFEGGESAAVCTWNGDVWIVDGIGQSEGELKWQRICSGLFQPLGLKIIDGEIYVGCRDMIAILRDFNGDRETDFIENFNSDHQVTEHFHEFAMGLQADSEGNLYYAKSARHAKEAVVPHHGTLLKVSHDGLSTEILATGFRAANGVCLNPDGSFMVTDQEGHWTPKNRINWVRPSEENRFYGNMSGYHSVDEKSDSAMNQPLCWVTNSYDRSPAELLWVPEDSAWKPLRGSLLNLSYGEGRIYTVPFEEKDFQVQGGVSRLPLDALPTGIMRGRFSPLDGQFYGCGMFAWAGNRQQPGGFYRIRYTGGPAHQPVDLKTAPETVTITFSDPLDPRSAADLSAWAIRAWDIKRTRNYGSKHFNEREWKVSEAAPSEDGKSATLTIPELAPTWGMSIEMNLLGSEGEEVVREIHNSIFNLN